MVKSPSFQGGILRVQSSFALPSFKRRKKLYNREQSSYPSNQYGGYTGYQTPKKELEKDKATIIEWLNDKFPVLGFQPFNDNNKLVQHFIKEFDVNVSIEGDLYIFKYKDFTDKWNNRVTRQSRGIIIRCDDNGWKVASRPFEKFHNIHEARCPIRTEEKFTEFYADITIHEKIDGTCIQLWYDEMIDEWRISTLGKITTANVGEFDFTFEDLFWQNVNIDRFKEFIYSSDMHDVTFIFELACDTNRVVSDYGGNFVYLIAARDINTGNYMDIDDLQEIAGDLEVEYPFMADIDDVEIKSIHDLIMYVEQESANEDYGKIPEGFVLCHKGFPIAKVKNLAYRTAFKKRIGTLSHNKIITMCLINEMTDFDNLPDPIIKWIDEINEWKTNAILEAKVNIDILSIEKQPTRKQFAKEIDFISKEWKPFFFERFDDIYNTKIEEDSIQLWIEDNFMRFVDVVKVSTKLPELKTVKKITQSGSSNG